MKKNRMLRLASALLILTLLTTSVIGGTFAKYVSEGSVSDTARVAKWGVEIKTSGTLYSDAYAISTAADSKGNLPTTWNTDKINDKSITVATKTDGAENIVAPGTKSYGEGLSFALVGAPEVAVTVKATIEAEDIFLAKGTYGILEKATNVTDAHAFNKLLSDHTEGTDTNKKYNVFLATTTGSTTTYARLANDAAYIESNAENYYILTDKVTFTTDYFPVVYTLAGETTDADAKTAIAVAKKLAQTIKSDANDNSATSYKTTYTDVSATYAANIDLATAGPKFGEEKLTWEWTYEGSDTATDNDKAEINRKDTLLGDLMAMRAAKTTTPTAGTVDYVIVNIDNTSGTETITALDVQTTDNDYTVTKGTGDATTVVANLRTKFDIKLTVEQVD